MYNLIKYMTNDNNNNNSENIEELDSNQHFSILQDIHTLFIKNDYKYLIGSKADANSINQKIIYYKETNINYSFIIEIKSKKEIDVIIPLTYTNFEYRTRFTNINDVLEYITLHI